MPTLSPADLSVYRAGQPHIRRYVSVAPRTSVYTATISAIVSDADTGGIHQLTLTGGAGVLADVRAGFTVDLGTTAGARDVGQLRVRRTPTGAALDVGETAPGVCPAAVGQHITVRRERRVWRTLPRIVASSVGTAFPNTFTAYADYDIAYTNQNDAIQPHANITTDAAGIPVRPAGFVDVGQSYRTVMLHAGTSVTLAHGAAIAAYAWDVGDGTITVGSPTSAAISARFPAGFRYIALTVTDTNGAAHTRYLPVWTHDAAHPPLTAFRVVRDVRSADAGRAMTLEWFGADASLDAAAFPEGAALCYWEIAQFGASAVGAPASHTDALLGWALRDAETLRIADQARLRVEMGGVSAWLDRSAATPQTLRDPGVTATAWDQMRRLTADRAAHYALRQWSSALDLANFYPSGVTDEAQTVTLDGISVWRAAANAAAAGRVGGIGCDALNGVWLRRDFNHLSATERAARPVVVALTSADWTDADGLTVETERLPRVGMVEARGSAWDGVNTATPYASRAPGRTSGQGASTGRIAVQILPTVDAQTTLNALVGHVYAAQNNPRADIRLRLLHPIDALEPAWDEPVTLTWAAGGLRATAISALACRVTRVEIDHDNPAAPKIVRWTLTPTTSGQPGASVPVTVVTTNPPLDPPLPPVPPDVLTPNTGRIAVFCTDNRVYRTTDFLAASPRWTSVNLAVLANWAGGTLLDFAVDAYSPGYIGGGSAVNGWIVTTAGVQRITDIFGTPALGTATALYGSSPVPIRQIQ
ncbi:MAG: hypothetical protein SGI73_08060, partial [Chloroflexota bacterium]|nr:hypothetical protein [Chloroflexota bacterium]